MAGDMSCAREITELVQTLLCFCAVMWVPSDESWNLASPAV